MKDKIINIDFTRPDDRFLEKARAARDAEDLVKAMTVYYSRSFSVGADGIEI